jgi:hypothetical protein
MRLTTGSLVPRLRLARWSRPRRRGIAETRPPDGVDFARQRVFTARPGDHCPEVEVVVLHYGKISTGILKEGCTYPARNLLLEPAIKRVFNTRMMVVRQRQRIERLRNLGCTTHSAEQTLQELEKSLAIFETRERELKERFQIRQSAKSNFQ